VGGEHFFSALFGIGEYTEYNFVRVLKQLGVNSMSIPAELSALIDQEMQKILDDPQGEFGPMKRRAFVEGWISLGISVGNLAYRFLNVLAAERVIPIYDAYMPPNWTNNWYHRELPKRLTQIAKATLTQEIPGDVAANLANSHHYVIGNMEDQLACNAFMALSAANKALGACPTENLLLADFDVLSRVAFVGTYKVATATGQLEKQNSLSSQGERFSDLDWAKHGSSDTAAVAAIAWSCTENSYEPEAKKLKNFWDWWLNTATPEAWYMAGYKR
jgi:hypothetical protein